MTAPAEDGELLQLSAAGDRAAFTRLVDRHLDAVHRLVLSLGASADDAEDAVQECFLAAWRSAGTFRGGGSARGWLFTIARNAVRRQHRRRAGEPARHDSLEELGSAAGWGADEDFTHQLEVREMLDWALARIPAEEARVVLLRDVEGFSGEEVAAALGVSVPAMKSRLH